MRDSGILRSFGVFAPQDDARTIFSIGGRPEAGDAYARDDTTNAGGGTAIDTLGEPSEALTQSTPPWPDILVVVEDVVGVVFGLYVH
jgi:hypothetical protein